MVLHAGLQMESIATSRSKYLNKYGHILAVYLSMH